VNIRIYISKLRTKLTGLWLSNKKMLMPILFWVIPGVIGVLLILQAGVLAMNAANHQRPILGLKLDNRPVGRADKVKLKRYVLEEIRAQGDRPVTVVASSYSVKSNLRQLGANYDEASISSNLLQIGRTGNWWQRLVNQDLAVLGRRDIPVSYKIDSKTTKAYLAIIDHKITSAPTNAYFELQDGMVAIHPDKPGVSVNTKASLAAINSASDQSKQIVLPITQSPAPLTTATLEPLKTQAQNIASKPLTIAAGSASITLSTQQIVGLMEPKVSTPSNNNDKSEATLSFNEQKLNATVDSLLKQAEIPAQPRVIDSSNRVVSPGKAGLQAEGDHSRIQVLATLLKRESGASSPDKVELPMNKIDPPVVPKVAAKTTPAPSSKSAAPQKTTEKTSNPAVSKGTVYLTIDDGPGSYNDSLLDILKRYNVHATFYVIGRNVDRYPQSTARILSEGHSIGNHSFTHGELSKLTYDAILKELTDTQASIKKASGKTPTLFRPPYGSQNATVLKAVTDLGLSNNLWSVDPRDWSKPGVSVITQRVLDGLQPGAVILLHVLHQQTVDALPSIIEGIRAQGYTLD
jgi:peptidoglycan/xylan/chitin deacetylase (PgdA/CDA1 family)